MTRNGTSLRPSGKSTWMWPKSASRRRPGRCPRGMKVSRCRRRCLRHVALDLGIAAAVAVLVAEATEHLGGGVPLLGRGVLVVGEDLVDDRLDRARGWGPARFLVQRLGMGLGMLEDMPDGLAGVSELPGDLADGHAIAPRPPNRAVVVHREHVLGLRVGDRSL